MPRPRYRSRSLRRVFVRIPSGKSVLHYKKRKPKQASCSDCGAALKGITRGIPNKLKKTPKTKKRVERPYSNLCSKCMRNRIIKRARENV